MLFLGGEGGYKSNTDKKAEGTRWVTHVSNHVLALGGHHRPVWQGEHKVAEGIRPLLPHRRPRTALAAYEGTVGA